MVKYFCTKCKRNHYTNLRNDIINKLGIYWSHKKYAEYYNSQIYWCILSGLKHSKPKYKCLRCKNTNFVNLPDNVVQCLNCGKLFHVLTNKGKEELRETNATQM